MKIAGSARHSLGARLRQGLQRTRAFWISMFLTLILFGVAAGLLTVDYRCRTAVSPAEGTAVSLQVTGLGTEKGKLTFRWFSSEINLSLCARKEVRELAGAIPILIPRSVRIAAYFLPHQTEQPDILFTTRQS